MASELMGSDGPSQQSDVAAIASANADRQSFIWFNQSRAETNDKIIDASKNTFPFARLARATTIDQQITYLYHQMNGTTFAEETFEISVGDWGETTYINVTPPP